MRTSHIYLYGVAAATVVLVAFAPANGQDSMAPGTMQPDTMQPDRMEPGAMPDLTSEQAAEREAWPTNQQAAYDAWPDDAKAYYWSLPSERQEIFWRLRDEDKVAITRMNGDRQEAAWTALEGRMANSPGGI